MYLKRKIDEYLAKWKENDDRYPLLVKGPRQVGKTESIMHFAKQNYEQVIYINFIEEPKYKAIIEDGYSPDDIIKIITRIDPSKSFVNGKTLLFLDEIQVFPEIATSLKFFKIDGRFDVICSGSLLGLHYQRIESNSVGYKVDYEMSSLDFEEFLWAKGYGNIADEMLTHMQELKPFSTFNMKLYSDLFIDFCLLGGMPKVVKEYIINGNFSNTLFLQRQLLLDYEEDIRKYAEGIDQTRILNVFRNIPVQLAKENKKFQISKVSHGARFKDYRGCIEWLNDTGIVNQCFCMHYPELPLKGNFDDSKYKLYIFDTGLLVAMLDDEIQVDLRVNKNLGIYKGALIENVVSEGLHKAGYDLYYYKKDDSTLEEDFFLRTVNNLIPIEVKATTGDAKSLRNLIDNEIYKDISFGIKLSGSNIGFAKNIYTFPYFCTFLLKRYLSEK